VACGGGLCSDALRSTPDLIPDAASSPLCRHNSMRTHNSNNSPATATAASSECTTSCFLAYFQTHNDTVQIQMIITRIVEEVVCNVWLLTISVCNFMFIFLSLLFPISTISYVLWAFLIEVMIDHLALLHLLFGD